MATDKLLSVIVPVYNVEKYLDKCLDSLVNQTLEDIEIIVVNDGTKDNSQTIIDRYVDKYPEKVRSFIKENGGLSDARNFGFQYASGKYLTFLDSDDYVDNDYYEVMLKKAIDEDLDLVVSDIQYYWEDGSRDPFIKEGLNNKANSDISKALFLSPLSVCNKLFKRELFESLNLRFYKNLWYEDIPVALMYFANCNKVGYNTTSRYHYLQRSTSILGSDYSPKMYDIFTIFDRVIEEFKKRDLYTKYHDELEYLLIEHFMLYGAFRFLRTDHYNELMPKAFDYVRNEFPDYYKNKYINLTGIKNRFFLSTNNKSTMSFWHWYLTRNRRSISTKDNLVSISSITKPIVYKNTYKYDLSIIVPVYNVEKYLDKCLNSLVNQTISNYEIIVVNDGTKDNSQEIIDKYVNQYPDLVKSFIKENGGLSDARNYGLKHASGKYVSFLDSDDSVEKDYYAGMYNLASKNDLDLVVADLEYVWENNEKPAMYKEGLNMVGEEINKMLFLSPLFAWNKMYKHELFEQLSLEYPTSLWYEDIPVTLAIFSNANRIGYYHHVGVHYLQRNTSILGSGYSPKMYDIFKIFDRVTDNFKKNGQYSIYRDELEYLYIEHFLVYGAFRFLRTEQYKDLMSKAFEYVKNEFPNYRKNKYIKTFGIKNVVFLLTNNKTTMSFWHWYLSK